MNKTLDQRINEIKYKEQDANLARAINAINKAIAAMDRAMNGATK